MLKHLFNCIKMVQYVNTFDTPNFGDISWRIFDSIE